MRVCRGGVCGGRGARVRVCRGGVCGGGGARVRVCRGVCGGGGGGTWSCCARSSRYAEVRVSKATVWRVGTAERVARVEERRAARAAERWVGATDASSCTSRDCSSTTRGWGWGWGWGGGWGGGGGEWAAALAGPGGMHVHPPPAMPSRMRTPSRATPIVSNYTNREISKCYLIWDIWLR